MGSINRIKFTSTLALATMLVSLVFSTMTSISASDGKKESKSLNNVSALNEESRLQNLINSDAELKTHYNSCLQQGGDWTGCLWQKVQNNSTLKKKVQTAAEQDKKVAAIVQKLNPNLEPESIQSAPSRAPASSGDKKEASKIVAKDNTVKIDTAKDPFIIKLQENIQKQLDAVFTTTPDEVYKDSKGQVITQAASRNFLATDHSKFASLYNTHLSNSIVQSMSTFCSEAKYDSSEKKFFLEKDSVKRAITLEANIGLLKTAKLTAPPPEYKKFCIDYKMSKNQAEVAEGMANCPQYDPCDSSSKYYDESSCRFNGCIPAVSKLCYNNSSSVPSAAQTLDKEYTQTRACEVMEFVKSARAAIMALDNQEKFYRENTEKNAIGISLKGMKEFKSEDDVSRNSQDIVTITSKVVKEADEKSKDEIAAINCIDENSGQITNQAACDKLVIEDKEKASRAVAELSLRRQVQLDKIEELTTVDQLKEFLLAEGETEESADAYIEKITAELQSNPGNTLVDELKKRITNKYKAETDAIVKGLAEKVKEQSIDQTDSATDKTKKYAQIQKELKAKGERYTNMLHFGNVVSAYLTITDNKTGKSSANANQLYRELASRKDLDYAKKIEENAQKAGLNKSNEDTASTTLDVKLINDEILKKNEAD